MPLSLDSDPRGLLPWGITDNGDVLFWLTVGRPDQWSIAVNESRGNGFETYPDSMVRFLIKLIQEEIHSAFIPRKFLDTPCLFN